MSVTGHIIGNWNITGDVSDGGGTNVVPNPPEEATDSLEKVAIDDVVYSITGEQEQADWDQADPTAVDYIKNKPTIPAAQVNSDWDAASGVAEILNKPTLSAVATSGSYTDLTDTPTIPAAQVNSDWDAASGVAQILNKPSLSTVATSGDYDDLINKPTIPAAQVNSDWNANSGVAQILNKPTIPAAQVNSDWDAASGVAQILNKPTLATVATSGEAEDVSYDNSVSGMTATDVQAAVDELKSNLIELQYTDIGTSISLTANTDYLTLSDGYFTLTFNGGDVSGNHYAYGSVNGVRLLSLNSPKTVATYGYVCDSVFVRKGSTIKFEGDSLARGAFRPLIAPTP